MSQESLHREKLIKNYSRKQIIIELKRIRSDMERCRTKSDREIPLDLTKYDKDDNWNAALRFVSNEIDWLLGVV